MDKARARTHTHTQMNVHANEIMAEEKEVVVSDKVHRITMQISCKALDVERRIIAHACVKC